MFWNAASNFFNLKLPRLHPVTWKKDLLDPEFIKKDHVAIAILVMWAIWSNRSKYAHGEVKFQPHKSMEIIYELIRALDIPSPVAVTNVGSKST